MIERPPEGHESLIDHIRALIFIFVMYFVMFWMGLFGMPWALASRRGATWWVKTYCAFTMWLLRVVCGTRTEIRGTPPKGECLVASKHQAFLDVLLIITALDAPRFVMKRSLRWVPILGIYAMRMGGVAIDRDAKSEAVRTMVDRVSATSDYAGQTIIFPQGTRQIPGQAVRYRSGIVRLYQQFNLPIALAGANTGWFWPRIGTRRSRGTAVVEFLETIPPDQPTEGMLARIEAVIERSSDALAAEAAAGFAARGVIARPSEGADRS